MSSIGTGELIMLAIIILIVFSASRMGALGNSLGRFVYSFKKASQGDGFVDVKPTRLEKGTVDAEVISKTEKH
jgi:sec-independent protein translocase protein TatA